MGLTSTMLAATLPAAKVLPAADHRLEAAAASTGSAFAAAASVVLHSAAAELPFTCRCHYGEKAARSLAESVCWGRSPALSTSEAWTDAILMAATRRTRLQMCCVTVSVDAVGSRSRSHIMARSSGSSLSPARSMKVVVTWRVECMWIKAFFIF